MAITDYSTLTTAINDWSERSYSSDKLQEFVALAEGEFNLVPGFKTYRRETTEATLTTDSGGEVALPSGFMRMGSIVRDYAGALPLTPVPWSQLRSLNPDGGAGQPIWYAISGTKLRVAPVAEADFLATYETSLTPLTVSTTTNWLITLSPNVYLYMCLAVAEAYNKNFDEAAAWKSQALEKLAEIGVQSDLGQYANAGIEFETPVP